MKRIERIYSYVCQKSHSTQVDELTGQLGVTTQEIADELQLLRSNVSKDLNQLCQEGKLEKTQTRPVRYSDAKVVMRPDAKKRTVSYKEASLEKSAKPNSPSLAKEVNTGAIFDRMIGRHGSLKTQIEQAKASVLYPPRGLNTLIIGPTGSGKTFFANAIFQYAQSQGVLAENCEMVVLNCADYAHNPQLLLSYLFGHVKGAYTGAEQEKDGLLAIANDTILFLDEVHRLPPEAQEMLFYFMDTGSYRKMGETSVVETASVRIICATTEDPKSSLLSTFLRRIPIVIQLPPFSEREVSEQVLLIKFLFTLEAKRVQKNLIVEEDVIKALIGSVTYGNIGQLKSHIQTICAKGFLMSISDPNTIHITFNDFRSLLEDGYYEIAQDREKTNSLKILLDKTLVLSYDDFTMDLNGDTYELPYNLYEIIGDKLAMMKNDGMSEQQINDFLSTDIDLHLKAFYKDTLYSYKQSNLADIVDESIIQLSMSIQKMAEDYLNQVFSSKFLYAMSLHISSFISRSESKTVANKNNQHVREVVSTYVKETECAILIKDLIEEQLGIRVPEVEVDYLTMLLISLSGKDLPSESVGIVVACHGNDVATGMVDVVKELLQSTNIEAVNMPLTISPKVAYEQVKHALKKVDKGNGVLYFCDMGSLRMFGEQLQNELCMAVETHDMVSTPLLLEAARKTQISNQPLPVISRELRRFSGYAIQSSTIIDQGVLETSTEDERPIAIVAVCSTGQGSAQALSERIEQLMGTDFSLEIKLITLSVLEAKEQLASLKETYKIAFTTGITCVDTSLPYISMEMIFSQEAKRVIIDMMNEGINFDGAEEINLTRELCLGYLSEHCIFLNPHKLVDLLMNYVNNVDNRVHVHHTGGFKLAMILHLAKMIERSIQGESLPLPIERQEQDNRYYQEYHQAILKENQILEEKLNICIPSVEQMYLVRNYMG